MKKIIAYLATSADGFIARPDGDVSWLDRPRPKDEYGMPAFLKSVDTVVMGRSTYDAGQQLGGALIHGKKNIVLSRTLPSYGVPGAAVESGAPESLAARLRNEQGKNVWLMGGAVVFSAFLEAGALDELVIHVVPVLIGTGIPLLDAKPRQVELKLKSTRRFTDGVVRLHYEIDRTAPSITLTESGGDEATATATD
ncbi:MAG TPA: dihydrofolate reductase family protein [Gemmatimonadaceae bacterium]